MQDPEFQSLKQRLGAVRYMLVMDIPYYVADDGAIWLDKLWARDLMRHLDYISDLTILAPRAPLPVAGLTDGECISPLPAGLRFAPLPYSQSSGQALVNLPAKAIAAYRAINQADLVHSGALGWPIPPGLLCNRLAYMMGKHLVFVIESTSWRGDGRPRTLGGRIMAAVAERMAHHWARRADLVIFTHPTYEREFGSDARGTLLVTPASWIDATDILSQPQAQDVWATKAGAPRFLFAGRMVDVKGVRILLDALDQAEARALPLHVDMIGEGPLEDVVADRAEKLRIVQLRKLKPVSYGADFLSLLRQYHAVLVPSLSDEQPRILYDAFSQGVTAIASDTSGHRSVVQADQTGLLVPVGDAGALLSAMTDTPPARLQALGMAGRDWVGGRTHDAMHLARARVLADKFGLPG